MNQIKIQAGDFKKGSIGYFIPSMFGQKGSLMLQGEGFISLPKRISAKEIESLEVATEENVKKLAGTVGWGVAGGILLGPVGLLAGLLAGGNKKEVTFTIKFKDGRKLLATTDNKTFIKLQAETF